MQRAQCNIVNKLFVYFVFSKYSGLQVKIDKRIIMLVGRGRLDNSGTTKSNISEKFN